MTLEPLGSVTLKGRAGAVAVYRVVSLEPPAGAATTPFVGRDGELARLEAVYDAAVGAPATRLAVVLGSPGLGKSRLIGELARRLDAAATVLTAHCEAAGGATFAPLADAVRGWLRLDDGAGADVLRSTLEAALPHAEADRARIVAGTTELLTGAPRSPEETFSVARRLLAALASVRPVVLVIDDLHWAEPLLIDLVEHLVQWGGGVPVFVLVGARPELRDARAALTTQGGLVADVLTLGGLDAGAATRLAASVIGAADLPAAVAAKVLATSEGNPLFVGELVRMLVHEGALLREGERWIVGAGLAALAMPPTIHALLAARIERLRAEERTVLERAAVVGRHFSRSAVAELLGDEADDLDARLEALRRGELVERDAGRFLGEPAWRFHHVLIRDAAYRRLLKGTRAELHARVADWVTARVGEAVEHDETIGWHFEQAHQHLRELGPLDDKGRLLGARAARHLAAAGRRALARDDVRLAAGLLGRAIERVEPNDPTRAGLALDWCEALLAAGEVGPAGAAIDELARFTADSARLRAWHACFTGQRTALTAPEGLTATVDAVAAAAETLTALGDATGEAKAHAVHAQALARLGQIGGAEAALDRALAAARRAGDRRRANAVLAGAPLAALWGPSPVTRASGRCLDVVRVLRITQGAPVVEAVALSCQGVLEALRGRTDAARHMIASARAMVEEIGITHRLLEIEVFAGRVDLLVGDARAAERSLRGAYEGLRDIGLGIDAARAGALLARALLALDRVPEAEAQSHESEALAGDDLQAAIAWRGVRAEALARRGEHAAAVALASTAVEIAAATDALLDHADARLALAAALRAAGRGGEADAEERRATELWEIKGATLLVERALRSTPREPGRDASARVPPPRRRVRPNAATASAERFAAARVTPDVDALGELLADDHVSVHHPTGTSWGRAEVLTLVGQIASARDLQFRSEPLATLGDALLLERETSSFTAFGDESFGPFGAVEREHLTLLEVDASGRLRRVELFAADHPGAAVARLYELYAELLPAGQARRRAAATARAVALTTLADDAAVRVLDLVRLEPGALLVRAMGEGTDRAGGGAFEVPRLVLRAFDGDGLLICNEVFDGDREAEALARFEALTAAPPRPVRRGVAPNAASATLCRFEAAFAAGDTAALAALFGDALEVVDHPNGASYGREGQLQSLARLRRMQDATLRVEPLATLGESLVLWRRRIHAAGTAGGRFDVGEYEREEIVGFEVDRDGCVRRIEIFAGDHLGDAVIRSYARHAELLPDESDRPRAMAVARSVAGIGARRPSLAGFAAALAPAVEFNDHRVLGLGAGRGVDALVGGARALFDLADDVVEVTDDVLRLEARALVRRATMSGKDRAGGGIFEVPYVSLWVFGDDGRVSHYEAFDADREAEALARLEALTGSALPEPFANAASRALREFERAWRARDWDGVRATYHPAHRMDDRRRLMRVEVAGDAFFANERMLFDDTASQWQGELLATRGERLALFRVRFTATVGGSGPMEVEALDLVEVDAAGRRTVLVVFDLDDRSAAYDELDARAEAFGAAPASDPLATVVTPTAATAFAERWQAAFNARDWDALRAGYAPDVKWEDRRRFFQLAGGLDLALSSMRERAEAGARVERRVMGTAGERVLVQRVLWSGGPADGRFEIEFLAVIEVDESERATAVIVFDPEDTRAAQREAWARWSAIDPVAAPWTAMVGTIADGFNAHDRAGLRALVSDDVVVEDHGRTGIARIEGAAACIDGITALWGRSPDHRLELGWFWPMIERHGVLLTLRRSAERDLLCLCTATGGRMTRLEMFELEDVDSALARLAELRPDPLRIPPNAATRAFDRWYEVAKAGDWEAVGALYAPGCTAEDRRQLMHMAVDREMSIANDRHIWESGVRPVRTVLATAGDRLSLQRMVWVAGNGGQTSEVECLEINEVDGEGRFIGNVIFDPHDRRAADAELFERSARSAFPPLVADTARAFRDRDHERMRAGMRADFVFDDHRRTGLGRIEGADAYLAALRALYDLSRDASVGMPLYYLAIEPHGHLCVAHTVGMLPEGGEFESVFVTLIWFPEGGRLAGVELFELEDLDAARARFAGLGAGGGS